MTTEPATTRHQDLLNDCVEFGHRLARLAVDRAEADTLAVDKAAAAYERVTRSMRHSIWLVRKLAEPVKTIDRIAARKRIIRSVEDAIGREAEDPDALHEELRTRLETPDLDDEIDTRPVADIITDIIHDLGLAAAFGTTPWKRRTPADLAELHALAAEPAVIRRPQSARIWIPP